MKKNREKKKNKYNENNLEEPLNNQDMKLNINIINSDLEKFLFVLGFFSYGL